MSGWVHSVYDTLNQGQVHDFMASTRDTEYGSHWLERH